jgi:hypothetical protein
MIFVESDIAGLGGRMRNLFEQEAIDEEISRIDKLQPESGSGENGRRADDDPWFGAARHGRRQAQSAATFFASKNDSC